MLYLNKTYGEDIMNYDKIIIELLDRIKILEDRVDALEKDGVNYGVRQERKRTKFTDEVKEYIGEMKRQASERGEKELICICNDIQKHFGVLNRARSVCDAMYKSMSKNDVVLFAPPSMYSTTVKIKYFL